MAQSSIEWPDAVWNPVTGCTKVSQGCKNCYAERMAQRFAGMNGYPADDPFRVTLHPDKLDLPLRWRKPRRIFVNSMSDLFHKDVPDEFIDKVFAVMALAPRHTFQILTKRPERMLSYLSAARVSKRVDDTALAIATKWDFDRTAPGKPLPTEFLLGRANEMPLPNVWLGTSVENQQAADERIPLLLQTPAAVRWISAEPLLGPIQLSDPDDHDWLEGGCGCTFNRPCGELYQGLDWVVVGGESGPGARPMHPDWARSLRDQCKSAGVPFLFKQHGEWREACPPSDPIWNGQPPRLLQAHGTHFIRVGKASAGRLLDGVLHDEYPEVR